MNAYYINNNIVRTLTESHFRPEGGDYDIQIGTIADTRELEIFFNKEHEEIIGENIATITSKSTELQNLSFSLGSCANGQIRMKSTIVDFSKREFCEIHDLHNKNVIIIFNEGDGNYTFEFYRK